MSRITASDKVLHDKAFDIAKYPKCDRFQRGFASSGGVIKREIILNKRPLDLATQSLAEEFHKSIVRTLKKTNHSLLLKKTFGLPI